MNSGEAFQNERDCIFKCLSQSVTPCVTTGLQPNEMPGEPEDIKSHLTRSSPDNKMLIQTTRQVTCHILCNLSQRASVLLQKK